MVGLLNGRAGSPSSWSARTAIRAKLPAMQMQPFRDLGRYGTVGLELLVSMALGYYGGRWLDRRFGGHGWLTGIGAFLGVVVGFYSLWKASQTMQRDIERAERKEAEDEARKRGDAPPWT